MNNNNTNKKLFIDYDGVTVSTIEQVVSIYDMDFKSHKDYKKIDWSQIDSWEFKELTLTTREHINTYFEDCRFFKTLNFMENAFEVITSLSEEYEIIIVTMGTTTNLKMKEEWLKNNLPCMSEFIGVNFNQYKDKSHIDMSSSFAFIDDSSNNLETSNANTKILYGDFYSWNTEWTGLRLYNWTDVKLHLGKISK